VGTSAGGGTGHRAVKSEESRGRAGERLRGSERRTRRDQPLPDSLANVRAIPKARARAPPHGGPERSCVRRGRGGRRAGAPQRHHGRPALCRRVARARKRAAARVGLEP